MPRFRKKPVEVEAHQLTPDSAERIQMWCGGQLTKSTDHEGKEYVELNIPTLEGTMRASEGDWVIKGTRGEFYPRKQGPFVDTFDPIG